MTQVSYVGASMSRVGPGLQNKNRPNLTEYFTKDR